MGLSHTFRHSSHVWCSHGGLLGVNAGVSSKHTRQGCSLLWNDSSAMSAQRGRFM